MAAVADELGIAVHLLGTPAEEAGDSSGKIAMLERGAFEGIDAAMMVHPAPYDVAEPIMIAVASFDIAYTGKEAHAAMYPELGVNAADALTSRRSRSAPFVNTSGRPTGSTAFC